MTDDEKLRYAKRAFERKFASIETWNDFKSMVNNITKQRMKNFVRNSLQQAATDSADAAAIQSDKATELNDLVNEVDNL